MFFGSPEHLTFLRYEVLSPQRRYVSSTIKGKDDCSVKPANSGHSRETENWLLLTGGRYSQGLYINS